MCGSEVSGPGYGEEVGSSLWSNCHENAFVVLRMGCALRGASPVSFAEDVLQMIRFREKALPAMLLPPALAAAVQLAAASVPSACSREGEVDAQLSRLCANMAPVVEWRCSPDDSNLGQTIANLARLLGVEGAWAVFDRC